MYEVYLWQKKHLPEEFDVVMEIEVSLICTGS